MTSRAFDRSLGADVVRTSECGLAASKRPPSRSAAPPSAPLAGIDTDGPWLAAVEDFRARNPRRLDRLAAYERLLAGGEHRRIGADVLAGRHRPEPPAEGWLNKADGRKKRIFRYGPADELLFRVVNRALQPVALAEASPWCQSFLPGGGARAAFRRLLADRDLAGKAAARLDVRDYFNSIDVDDLLARLPAPMAGGAVRALLDAALLDRRVRRDGTVVADGGRKGVMAGTPLAPLLATLYLRDVDGEIGGQGVTYARYSDDIVVLASPGGGELARLEALLRRRLQERGLEVNEAKSAVAAPGEPWDFLGFRYNGGVIGLAPITVHKLKARTTRLARRLLRWRDERHVGPERVAAAFVRRVNRRLYATPGERADFSWATWFFPLLSSPDGLAALDAHVQREARYAASGRRTARARRLVPYDLLVEVGHLPLVPAYWAMRDGADEYDALVRRRTGIGAVSPR